MTDARDAEIAELKRRLADVEAARNHPLAATPKPKKADPPWLIWAIAGFIILALLSTCLFDRDTPKSTWTPAVTSPAPDPGVAESVAKTYAERQVRAILKDPDSATFGDEWVRSAKLPIVCGTVNAKNSFGGFTGQTSFLVFGSAAYTEEGEHRNSFVSLWNKLCVDQPTSGRHKHHHHGG